MNQHQRLKPNFAKIAPLSAELVDGMNQLGQMAHYIGRNAALDRAPHATDMAMDEYDRLEAYLIGEYPEEKMRIISVGIRAYMRGEGVVNVIRRLHANQRGGYYE